MDLMEIAGRVCDWCGENEVDADALDSMECELRGCDAVFCDTSCADFHMGKHEDAGDCQRDRDGNVTRDYTRRARRGVRR